MRDVLMYEILTRFPTKSLMRFKCVSKLWSSVISSLFFTNRFLNIIPSQPRLYMCLADIDKIRNSRILALSQDNTNNTSNVSSSCFIVDHDLAVPRDAGCITQNLYGFMCMFGFKPIIYNPATRQLVTIPWIKGKPLRRKRNKSYFYYFGHDPVTDQFKVICSISPNLDVMPEHWVFVLKPPGGGGGGGFWRKTTPPTPPEFCPHIPSVNGMCINGFIYYLAWIDLYIIVLVSFDIRHEEFNMIQVPSTDPLLPWRFRNVVLVDYGGKVTLLDHTNLRDKGMVDLWIYGNKEWSTKKTLVLPSCQVHLVTNIVFKVKATTQTSKILLIPKDFVYPYHILCYDLQKNDMRRIDIKGIPDYWFSMDKDDRRFDFMFMDQSESIMHLDTSLIN